MSAEIDRLSIWGLILSSFVTLFHGAQVKEMDDEEQSYHSLQEPSYRIETGNYEYR